MNAPYRFPLRENLPVDGGREQVEDWHARKSAFDVVDQLGSRIVEPGGTVPPQELRQSLFLLAGSHNGFECAGDVWRVVGAPGAQVRGRVVVTSGVVTFSGVIFRGSAGQDNVAALVEVASEATAVFEGCHFLRDAPSSGVVASIKSGGKAHFLGCVMEPVNPATSAAVDNAGVAGNVYIIGCSNLTGAAHNNVTTIAETT